jgi:RNA polymerase sigma-70 factor (ECF subfamily)
MDGTERALSLPLLRAKTSLVQEQADAFASLCDEDLVASIRSRDLGATLTLFRRYDRLALSIGYKVLRDQGEAEDLAQDVFLHLYAEAGTFDRAKGTARTWLVQMIYRRAFDRRAYLRRRYFYGGTDALEETNTLIDGRNREDEMIDRLTVEELKLAFSELSDRQRMTLEAFFFEGLKFAEIAERSGEDVKNVRHHYYRGLERLRKLVREMKPQQETGQ